MQERNPEQTVNTTPRFSCAELTDIESPMYQQRAEEELNEKSILELAKSVSSNGVLQPLIVRQGKAKPYQLIAGWRRFHAALTAQLTEVPICFVETDDIGTLELALIENVQRKDLSAIEEARAFAEWIEKNGFNCPGSEGYFHEDRAVEQLAEKIHRSTRYIIERLNLLDLPEKVQKSVDNGDVSITGAKKVVSLFDDPADQEQAAQCITQNAGLSMQELQKELNACMGDKKTKFGTSYWKHRQHADQLHFINLINQVQAIAERHENWEDVQQGFTDGEKHFRSTICELITSLCHLYLSSLEHIPHKQVPGDAMLEMFERIIKKRAE